MTERRRIQLLPEHLINQIKAGEVIDRPASLLKEIIENSLDAESSQINLHLVDNGLTLIALEDNGKGMSIDDLPYAFARHATSKLEKFEDLYDLHSFGFRGEALASIASIARVTCSSVPREQSLQGGKILIEGGEEKNLVPYTDSHSGTALYIKDLFFNTPVRLKFIKSKVAEKNSIKRILHSFLLAHPQVSFSLRFDDKEKQIFAATSLLKERVNSVLVSKGQQDSLVTLDENYEGYKLQAFFIPSDKAQNNNNFLFINKRFFIDKGIHQALFQHLEQLRPGERYQYAIFLEAPCDEIDVNIHPGKIEVKFFKAANVYSLISAALKKNFKKKERINTPLAASEVNQKAGTFHDFSPHSSFFEHELNPNEKKWKLLANISPCYQLILIDGKPYLLHAWNFVCLIFEKQVLHLAPLREESIIPLLVSEPYQKTTQIPLEFYQQWGLELDSLSPETIVLRTIPEALSRLPYRKFIEEILCYGKEDCSFEKLKVLKLRSDFFLQESHLASIWEESLKWQEQKILLPFDSERIKLLF